MAIHDGVKQPRGSYSDAERRKQNAYRSHNAGPQWCRHAEGAGCPEWDDYESPCTVVPSDEFGFDE